jgi:hypothetical protein
MLSCTLSFIEIYKTVLMNLTERYLISKTSHKNHWDYSVIYIVIVQDVRWVLMAKKIDQYSQLQLLIFLK